MAIRKERLRRLKEAAENLPPPPCPECGDTLKMVIVCEDDWYLFEGCEPCSLCDLAPLGLDPGAPEEHMAEAEEEDEQPATRLYYSCPEEPFEISALEELKPGDTLVGPDGTQYRKENL